MIALSHYNHVFSRRPDPVLHTRVIAMLVLWAVLSLAFQAVLRTGRRVSWARPAWLEVDVLLLTIILRLLNAAESVLVVGYPLLIAASGLWFRVRLVWFTTLLAEAAYAALALDAWSRGALTHEDSWPNIFMAALAVTGFVVAHQVKRLWALSYYYEHRPMT